MDQQLKSTETKQTESYIKTSNLIKKICIKYHKNGDIPIRWLKFDHNEESNLDEIVLIKGDLQIVFKLPITYNCSWKEIRSKIDEFVEEYKKNEFIDLPIEDQIRIKKDRSYRKLSLFIQNTCNQYYDDGHIPIHKLEYCFDTESNFVEIILKDSNLETVFKLSITDNCTWKEIKLKIDHFFNKYNKIIKKKKKNCNKNCICILCNNKFINDKFMTCVGCSGIWCIECYVKSYINGNGIITCPFCKFKYGQNVPEYLLSTGVNKIREIYTK